jgi:O-antigen/teichoic acid export membrane protein
MTGVAVVAMVAIANASNYAFQLVTGRFLGADAYGLLAGLMTVIAIIGVSASSLQTVAAKAVSAGEVRPHPAPDVLTHTAIRFGAGATLVFLVVSPLLSSFLDVGILPLLLISIFITPSLLGAIAVGRLQGQMRFVAMALFGACLSAAKLVVGVAVAAVGLGVTSIVAGLVITTTLVTSIGLRLSRAAGAVTRTVFDRSTAQVFVGVTLFWILVSLDLPFARAFFDEGTAGQYAAAAVVGRAVLWVPAVITQMTFPQMSQAVSNFESTEPLMLRAFALSTGLALAGVLGIWLFGEQVFSVVYGSDYPSAHLYAWKIALAAVPMTVVNLLLHHNFARNHTRFLGVLSVATVVQSLLLALVADSPDGYALVLGVVASGTAVALLPAGGWRFLVQTARPGRRRRG